MSRRLDGGAQGAQAPAPPAPKRGIAQPLLVFFTSTTNGQCRRAEGYLAQVLQRRRNHQTFKVRTVAREERPDLLERFRADPPPPRPVIAQRAGRGKPADPRGGAGARPSSRPWPREP